MDQIGLLLAILHVLWLQHLPQHLFLQQLQIPNSHVSITALKITVKEVAAPIRLHAPLSQIVTMQDN